ncbi:MAG: hypothetical protein ACE37B_12325 [Ilumatobacter sp.]|uniref:hypothetical protein n=1 Tax=Ilumatobacter sp. TaxID=1967498 RepID=UPI003919980C
MQAPEFVPLRSVERAPAPPAVITGGSVGARTIAAMQAKRLRRDRLTSELGEFREEWSDVR